MNNNKPLIMEIEEAKKELNAFIEQISTVHNLPCYLLELIVGDVLTRLQNGKQLELEAAKAAYEKQLKEGGETDV